MCIGKRASTEDGATSGLWCYPADSQIVLAASLTDP